MKPLPLTCATHGVVPWRGTVVCATDAGGCGRKWHLGDRKSPHYPPGDRCTCGADLTETARAICQQCFDAFTGEES